MKYYVWKISPKVETKIQEYVDDRDLPEFVEIYYREIYNKKRLESISKWAKVTNPEVVEIEKNFIGISIMKGSCLFQDRKYYESHIFLQKSLTWSDDK